MSFVFSSGFVRFLWHTLHTRTVSVWALGAETITGSDWSFKVFQFQNLCHNQSLLFTCVGACNVFEKNPINFFFNVSNYNSKLTISFLIQWKQSPFFKILQIKREEKVLISAFYTKLTYDLRITQDQLYKYLLQIPKCKITLSKSTKN